MSLQFYLTSESLVAAPVKGTEESTFVCRSSVIQMMIGIGGLVSEEMRLDVCLSGDITYANTR